jgi:putative glutamine amidotransferase
MKIYSGIYSGFHPLDVFFPDAECIVADTPDDLVAGEPGILIIHGGGDISPSLYNKAVGTRTGASEKMSRRDAVEWALIQDANAKGIFIFGICRGAQLLCAAAGGYLIQDVTNHASWGHKVLTNKGDTFNVNSIHHQMCIPYEVDHELLAWSAPSISDHYLDVDTPVKLDVEPEAIFYPGFKGLGIQWHPEMMGANEVANKQAFQWLKEKL